MKLSLLFLTGVFGTVLTIAKGDALTEEAEVAAAAAAAAVEATEGVEDTGSPSTLEARAKDQGSARRKAPGASTKTTTSRSIKVANLTGVVYSPTPNPSREVKSSVDEEEVAEQDELLAGDEHEFPRGKVANLPGVIFSQTPNTSREVKPGVDEENVAEQDELLAGDEPEIEAKESGETRATTTTQLTESSERGNTANLSSKVTGHQYPASATAGRVRKSEQRKHTHDNLDTLSYSIAMEEKDF